MLLGLNNDHKTHLLTLKTQSNQVLVDFCKLAIDFLTNGPNTKLYTTAAEKLNTSVDTVQNCVYSLVNLLLISCKHKLSEKNFNDTILSFGFEEEKAGVLTKFYISKQDDISTVISNLNLKEAHFHNLEWRFEVQVASRSLLQQVVPLITMDLSLKKPKENSLEFDTEHFTLQTDPTNLQHIATELEKALNESRSRHSRKIQRILFN